MNLLIFLLGLAALLAGAQLLVRGASRLALSFGISPLVVGLTVVAFGTSAPEAAVSAGAVLEGRGDLAIGNVVGSNIFNVLFILGVSALVAPLVVHTQVIRQEVPLMIAAALVLMALSWDGRIARLEAALLLVLLLAYTGFLAWQARKGGQDASDYAEEMPRSQWDRHWSVQTLLVFGGLGLLVLGSDWLVTAAVAFARSLGVSDVVIGLTIVAAGTSMPEVATSLLATFKGERDIAVGNVIGSNLFNILGCLGLSGVLTAQGLAVPAGVLNFDLWVMTAVQLACLPVLLTGRCIARWEGGLFLGYYAAYTAYLILAAQQHEALEAYSQLMMGFVVPLTIVTLAVVLIRRR